MTADAIQRVRDLCTDWSEVTERLSRDDRVAVWLAAPLGAREPLIEAEPARDFVPPYVGHRGGIGVYLHVVVDWRGLEELVGDVHHTVAARGR
jgi:hypothetical protein